MGFVTLAAALYYLHVCGRRRPATLPEDEVVKFCVGVAEENSQPVDAGAPAQITIEQIAGWFRGLFAGASRE